MKRLGKNIVVIIGCLCIVFAAGLFVYNKALTQRNYKNAKRLYNETEKLIPPVYMSGVKGNVVVEDYMIKATLTSKHMKCVISNDHDLPYYKNKMVVIPDYLKFDLFNLRTGEVITLKKVNGKMVSYKVTDHGWMPYKNLTKVGLTMYSRIHNYCYFVSTKKIS